MTGATRRAWLVDGAVAAALALPVVIAAGGGLVVDLGAWRLGLRGWERPALAAAALLLLRLWRSPGAGTGARDARMALAARLLLMAATLAGIGYWLAFLVAICGGSDSYGYVSASQRLLAGRLIEPEPMAAWLPVPNALAVATPAGYVPAPGGTAPAYPLGLPALMALATMVAGGVGPYLVAPVCGVVCVVVAWRLANAWYGPLAAWAAAGLIAWNPLVVTYAKQPMSDVAAAMWALLAVWWLRDPGGLPLAAGVATGLSFMTRPGGIGVVAVLAALSLWGRPLRWDRFRAFAIGAVPFACLQAWLQWHLYGSPLASGYGPMSYLFAGQSVWGNLGIYALGLWGVQSVVWFAGLAAAAWLGPRRPLAIALALLAGSAAPYLAYFAFDHWETLRFLLPALVLLTIVAGGGLAGLAARTAPAAAPMVVVVLVGIAAVTGERYLRHHGVRTIRRDEERYPRVAAHLERTTPRDAVILAAQHSGSIRHYGHRQTLRWDLLRAEDLAPVVGALAERGHAVYVVLEGSEGPRFEAQFAAPLARMSREGAGHVGNVEIQRLDPPARP